MSFHTAFLNELEKISSAPSDLRRWGVMKSKVSLKGGPWKDRVLTSGHPTTSYGRQKLQNFVAGKNTAREIAEAGNEGVLGRVKAFNLRRKAAKGRPTARTNASFGTRRGRGFRSWADRHG